MALTHTLPLLALTATLATTTPPAHAADPTWFVPPPDVLHTHTMDMTLPNNVEAVTVIAKRASHSFRSAITERQNDPRTSDAARPRQNIADQKPYCNATLRTVGGQPGTAADMITGAGAGSC